MLHQKLKMTLIHFRKWNAKILEINSPSCLVQAAWLQNIKIMYQRFSNKFTLPWRNNPYYKHPHFITTKANAHTVCEPNRQHVETYLNSSYGKKMRWILFGVDTKTDLGNRKTIIIMTCLGNDTGTQLALNLTDCTKRITSVDSTQPESHWQFVEPEVLSYGEAMI